MKIISVSLSYASVADITYFTFTKCFAFMYEKKLFWPNFFLDYVLSNLSFSSIAYASK